MSSLARVGIPVVVFAAALGCAPASPVAPAGAPDVSPPPAPVATPPEPRPADPTQPADLSAWTRLDSAPLGSWRARFPDEEPMDFDEYVESDPVGADDERNVLAFQPVGDFPPEARAALDAAAEFTGAWFDLPVQTLDPVPLTDNPGWFRTRGDPSSKESVRQYRTGWFLNDLLPDRRPQDAVVLLGVTMADLYPGPDWNYVFGEAHLMRRVGVYSLARYYPEFWGQDRTPTASRRALLRTLKVVVHEAGHTFGLEHCVTWLCTMNGSNSLQETDAQPLLLCPDCLKKLAWNREFDVAKRYRRLAELLDRHGFPDEAAWHRARAEGK